MTEQRAVKLLRLAALMAMLGLLLMVWSVLQPTVLPVMVAMTVGQGIGTLSFLLYLFVVIMDIRRSRLLAREAPPDQQEPPA